VIALHSSIIYDVYAIGFAPGFAYLGNVDKRIAMPRKETPRQKIFKGSVGIADQQTAIYPSDSPGGWQIIGRTPISLIDYNDDKLTKFETGDKVKFNPISRADFIDMGGVL
jgi:inhibitor of KinA